MKRDRLRQASISAAMAACLLGIIPATAGVRGAAMYACLAVAVAMLVVVGVLLGASRADD